MRIFFKKLWNFIQFILNKTGLAILKALKALWTLIVTRIWLVGGFLFTWIIPIYLLNEKIALTKNATLGLKLSFFGLLVALFLIIYFYKRINNKLKDFKPKSTGGFILQIILLFVFKAVNLGVVMGVLYCSTLFLTQITEWFAEAIISIAIGFLMYLIDRGIIFFTTYRKNRHNILIKYILASKELYNLTGSLSEQIEQLNKLTLRELKEKVELVEHITLKVLFKRLKKIKFGD